MALFLFGKSIVLKPSSNILSWRWCWQGTTQRRSRKSHVKFRLLAPSTTMLVRPKSWEGFPCRNPSSQAKVANKQSETNEGRAERGAGEYSWGGPREEGQCELSCVCLLVRESRLECRDTIPMQADRETGSRLVTVAHSQCPCAV